MYSYWKGDKEFKLSIKSGYETTLKNIDGVEKIGFIARMSNGMTMYTLKGYSGGMLTRHSVRKGTNIEMVQDVEDWNNREPINTLEEFYNAILSE